MHITYMTLFGHPHLFVAPEATQIMHLVVWDVFESRYNQKQQGEMEPEITVGPRCDCVDPPEQVATKS